MTAAQVLVALHLLREKVSLHFRKMFCRVLLSQNVQKHVRVEGYLPAGSMLLR